MARGARLKNSQGCWTDPAGFTLSVGDVMDADGPYRARIERLVADGIMEYCDKQEACQETEGAVDATPSDPATKEPDLGDSQGQAVAETDEGAADSEAALPEPVEKAAPAPTSKKRATRKQAKR